MSEEQQQSVISIRVRSQQGEEVFFKIKPTTMMEKVIRAFADKLGVDAGALRLTFDGERVQGNKSAQEIGLQDGDVLDVMEFQVGGAAF
jgi:small ubiquitin-related modifier